MAWRILRNKIANVSIVNEENWQSNCFKLKLHTTIFIAIKMGEKWVKTYTIHFAGRNLLRS